jgi:hypothetical protein
VTKEKKKSSQTKINANEQMLRKKKASLTNLIEEMLRKKRLLKQTKSNQTLLVH